MVKLSGGNRKKLEKTYPRARRFSKEQLGKYFVSWGQTPHLVKLGGEKVFRIFIEQVSGDGDKISPAIIDRDFYEDLIGRIILFRSLESSHGAGKNAIGQLRSAVVPYAMAILHLLFNPKKSSTEFDMELVWKDQGLKEQLALYLYDLMVLVNNLIKEYAESDDFGQYSKKEQMWLDIRDSEEVSEWLKSSDSQSIVNVYAREKRKIDRRKKKANEPLNFDSLWLAAELYSFGKPFYELLLVNSVDVLNQSELRRVERIKGSYFPRKGGVKDMSDENLDVIQKALNRVKTEHPEILDSIKYEKDESCINAVNQIVTTYDACIDKQDNIVSGFQKHEAIAAAKSYPYSGTILAIGKDLSKGIVPKLSHVLLVKKYFSDREEKKSQLQIAPS